MRIAITDANIFIDLFYMKQVPHLFSIGCEIITTDKVLLEIEPLQSEILYQFMEKGLLLVERIKNEDRLRMLQLRSSRNLSESDLSVICIAEKYDALVLSGDDMVRKTCTLNKIEIHGILWCLNQFIEYDLIEKTKACELLIGLMEYNKRLPENHCKDYIENKWGGKIVGE